MGDVDDPGFKFEARAKRLRGSFPAPVRITGALQEQQLDRAIQNVFFEAARVSRVSFHKMRFKTFLARDCAFSECDFRQVRSVWGSDFSTVPQSVYRDCRFDGADLRNFDPGVARFEHCSFVGARLDGWRATAGEFIDCEFSGPIRNVKFFGRPYGVLADHLQRTVNEFRGNDFRLAELVGTDFAMGIDIGAQCWPEDTAYIRLDRMSERIRHVRADVVRWSDLEARQDALSMLDILLQDVQDGQDELFARRSNLGREYPEVRECVWDRLATAI